MSKLEMLEVTGSDTSVKKTNARFCSFIHTRESSWRKFGITSKKEVGKKAWKESLGDCAPFMPLVPSPFPVQSENLNFKPPYFTISQRSPII
jgi:hypothetical protein